MTTPEGSDGATGGDDVDAVAASRAASGTMTQGEQLIALGALILLFVDIVADILLDEYGIGAVLWCVAVLALLVVWAHRVRGWALPVRYSWAVVFLGYAGGLVGLRWALLSDLENNLFDFGGTTIFFGIVVYLACAVMAFGAYRVSNSNVA